MASSRRTQPKSSGGILPPTTKTRRLEANATRLNKRRLEANATTENQMPDTIHKTRTMTPIPFQEFDENGEVRCYENGILPHWRQDHCTYFVTIRQNDALPIAVAIEIKHERKLWLAHQNIDVDTPNWKQQLKDLPPNEIRTYERMVGKLVNEKLDAGLGSCALRNPEAAKLIAETLEFFHGTRVWVGDYIVMPNHIHVLMRPMEGFELEDILFSIKSYSANQINRLVGAEGQFWQRESYDHIVCDAEQLEAFQHYIRLNPVKANLPATSFIHRPANYAPAP